MNSPNDSPAKTASGKDCKKCIQKGSMCVQHGGSRSPRGSSPTVRGSTAASPKKVSPRRVSSISPKKVNQGANEWEKSKFMRELTEKLESLAISPKKGSPKSKTSPKKGLRSPSRSRQPQPTDEYEEDILRFLKQKEKAVAIPKSFPKQDEVTENMRSFLIDWFVEVSQDYYIRYETFHLAVSIIDRYLALKHDIPKGKLQLYGMTALLIAGKYEEIFEMSVSDFVHLSVDKYTAAQIRAAEVEMLQALKYEITYPTCSNFADIYFDILGLTKEQQSMARYIMEISTLRVTTNKYLPSLVAAGAIFYAIRAIPGKEGSVWSAKMKEVTGYSEKKVRKVAILAASDWLKPSIWKASKVKYGKIAKDKVSTVPLVSEKELRSKASPVVSPKKLSLKKQSPKISSKKSSPVVSPKKLSPKKQSPKVSPNKPSPKKVVSNSDQFGIIRYSDKYTVDGYEYRHVILPPEITIRVSRKKLLTEEEWRGLGVQQARGWVNYAKHLPEPNVLLFRKPL